MMKKIKILLYISIALICGACNSGNTTNSNHVWISASTTIGCSTIVSQQCFITLTYNTGGNAGLNIGVIIPQTYIDFNMDNWQNSCNVRNTTESQICSFKITYNPESGACNHTQNMTFTLGSALSNQVSVSDPIPGGC